MASAKQVERDKTRKAVLKRVVKTPRTAAEIGSLVGMHGRGVGKILSTEVGSNGVTQLAGRPSKYVRK